MADVTQKIISGNPVKNSNAIVTVDKLGNKKVLTRTIDTPPDVTALENKLTAKFNKTYYEYNT